MNTQVKVGIAAAIVAALVALIVLDQKTTPKDDPAARSATGGDPATIVGSNQGADPAATRAGEDEINRILKNAEKQFGEVAPAKQPEKSSKGTEERNEKKISPTGEEYVIKEGDTLEKIAAKHKTTAQGIIDANPGLKPTALRVGKSIAMPGKQAVEKKEDVAKVEEPKKTEVLVQKPADPGVKVGPEGKKIY